MLHSLILRRTARMGWGVFTTEAIPAGTQVEESPVVVMDAEARALLDRTPLHDYIFEWGHDRSRCCMAMGYLPIYNHASPSNCEYEMDFEKGVISVKTVRRIEAGEQLFVNYNGDWDDPRPVWFKDLPPE
jgi:SET domain-containing protein